MPFSTQPPLSVSVLAVLLVLTTSSCHKKQVAVPVPSEPVPAVSAPAAEEPHQQPPTTTHPATAPAATTPAPAAASTPRDDSQYQKNKPPDQPPPPKHAAHPAAPAPTAPATPPPAPAAAAPPDTPRLGDILTPDQQRQYNTAIDVSLAHAQASLGFISTRQLTKEQQATVLEIQNFIQQAQEKRKNELAAAKSLAERAEVLSHDLVASLR
jgi:hypothetical protein